MPTPVAGGAIRLLAGGCAAVSLHFVCGGGAWGLSPGCPTTQDLPPGTCWPKSPLSTPPPPSYWPFSQFL